MGWQPQVNGHCVYLKQVTVHGNITYVKRRPAVITVVNGDQTLNLRVGHHGETYTNVPLRLVDNQVSRYIPY